MWFPRMYEISHRNSDEIVLPTGPRRSTRLIFAVDERSSVPASATQQPRAYPEPSEAPPCNFFSVSNRPPNSDVA